MIYGVLRGRSEIMDNPASVPLLFLDSVLSDLVVDEKLLI